MKPIPAAIACIPALFLTIAPLLHAQERIPFDQIGAVAQRQSGGSGISITSTATGLQLTTEFQNLTAEASADGLWLSSTRGTEIRQADRFRVLATAVGRFAGEPYDMVTLAPSGTVVGTDEFVAFARPELCEEYRVSANGVRQDFIIHKRPGGSGELSLHLGVTGAVSEATVYGAKLTLPDTDRSIAYSRLFVSDATGAMLSARIEVVSPGEIQILVDDRDATYPLRIDPTFSDSDWVSLNPGIPGTAGSLAVETTISNVQAVAVDANGHLYVAGNFGFAGGVDATRVAKWDGNRWSALGSGLNGSVYAIAAIGTDVYFGGAFTSAGGAPANRIAMWNGSEWSDLGSDRSGIVYAMAVSGNDLYVGGADRLSKWDGSSWEELALAESLPWLW